MRKIVPIAILACMLCCLFAGCAATAQNDAVLGSWQLTGYAVRLDGDIERREYTVEEYAKRAQVEVADLVLKLTFSKNGTVTSQSRTVAAENMWTKTRDGYEIHHASGNAVKTKIENNVLYYYLTDDDWSTYERF